MVTKTCEVCKEKIKGNSKNHVESLLKIHNTSIFHKKVKKILEYYWTKGMKRRGEL